jgi:membrane protease YdiL (CAAX protease family)
MESRVSPTRSLIGFLALFYLAWSARAVLLATFDQTISDPLLRRLWFESLRLLIWGIFPAYWLYQVDRIRPENAFRMEKSPDRKFLALGLGCLWVFAGRAVEHMQGNPWISIPAHLDSNQIFVGLLALPGVPVLEEFVFRGIVFKRLLNLMRPFWANLISSLLFGCAHLPGWFVIYHGNPMLIAQFFTTVVLFGVVLCFLFAESGVLWVPIAIHLLNNLLSGAPFR